jgi:hypothetical protein
MPNASRFHQDFPVDLAAATTYYDEISVRLGDRFRDSIRRMLGVIRERPESFGLVTKRLRVAVVPHFPYVILFRVASGTILFTGLFHAMSDPKHWDDRDAEPERTG